MAKSKEIKDYQANFFMLVTQGNIHIVYDDGDNDVMLSAAFASAMAEDEHLFNIISTAMIALIDEKEKYSSKKKPNPKQSIPKGATEGKPFVKTRKKSLK